MSSTIREIFFPCSQLSGVQGDWLLLALRLIFGTLLLIHGVEKIMSFDTLATSFPDPMGLGNRVSLMLAIFAEFFCSLGVITGFMFRLALIPVLITMCVAAFVAMKGAPWVQKELPLSYLLVFVLLMVTGPGKISLDALIVAGYLDRLQLSE